MVNNPLMRPYFLGGMAFGEVPLDFHEKTQVFGEASEHVSMDLPLDGVVRDFPRPAGRRSRGSTRWSPSFFFGGGWLKGNVLFIMY